MQAAFVDIGLEKNAFLYVDEVVAPEGLEGVPRRDIQSLLQAGQQVMVQVIKDAMGTKGARVTTEISLPGRFLVLMPFSDFVGVSKKLPEEERDRLHDIVSPSRARRRWASSCAPRRRAPPSVISTSDLEFLLRLWKRVNHQSTEALAPEVIYTEMDLALRLVRDVFSEEFRAHDRSTTRPTFEKVVVVSEEDVAAARAQRAAVQGTTSLFEAVRLAGDDRLGASRARCRCPAAAT